MYSVNQNVFTGFTVCVIVCVCVWFIVFKEYFPVFLFTEFNQLNVFNKLYINSKE